MREYVKIASTFYLIFTPTYRPVDKTYTYEYYKIFTDKEKAIKEYIGWRKGLWGDTYKEMYIWEIDPIAQTHTNLEIAGLDSLAVIKKARADIEQYAVGVLSVVSSRTTPKGATISLDKTDSATPLAISIVLDHIIRHNNNSNCPIKFIICGKEYKVGKELKL